LDRREELALLPLGEDEAGRLLTSVPEEGRGECWWLVLRDGTPVAGDGGGGLMLFAEVPGDEPPKGLAIPSHEPVKHVDERRQSERAKDASERSGEFRVLRHGGIPNAARTPLCAF
jgi:hypothetical protein